MSASTVSRLTAHAGLPRLHELDPVTGVQIRASRRTQHRYEREEPGDLIHIDVKKLGKIPDGGGWRLNGPDTINRNITPDKRTAGIGFDYVHAAVDDPSRLAYAEVLLNIAMALRVPLSYLLAPLGEPDRPLDLPNLSESFAGMTAIEFDAWLASAPDGRYQPESLEERNATSE